MLNRRVDVPNVALSSFAFAKERDLEQDYKNPELADNAEDSDDVGDIESGEMLEDWEEEENSEDGERPLNADNEEDCFEPLTKVKSTKRYISKDAKSILIARLAKHSILNREEETELFLKFNNGTQEERKEARDQIMMHNIRLVLEQVKRYKYTKLSDEDLIQEGILGLVTAIEKFDVSKGFRFSTYAVTWINQSVMRAIQDKASDIRVPVNLQEKHARIKKVSNKLAQILGREPCREEVAECIEDFTLDKIKEVERVMTPVTSMDAPVSSDKTDGDILFGNTVADVSDNPEESMMRSVVREGVQKVLHEQLSYDERMVIILKFGMCGNDPLTLKNIADQLNITVGEVKKIEKTAIGKLGNCKLLRQIAAY